MNVMTYGDYAARIDYDAEDEIFVGRIAGIRDGVSFHADSVQALREAFHEAVDDYVETCRTIGREPQRSYSGKMMFRVDPRSTPMSRALPKGRARASTSGLPTFSPRPLPADPEFLQRCSAP